MRLVFVLFVNVIFIIFVKVLFFLFILSIPRLFFAARNFNFLRIRFCTYGRFNDGQPLFQYFLFDGPKNRNALIKFDMYHTRSGYGGFQNTFYITKCLFDASCVTGMPHTIHFH